mmetsp:Transcript_62591/g.136072  ORF Transcript_62591/g.136072 Transcript_62591/m.136072 type:complete len:94 (-) Transcript_62591:36-317(-)
MPWARSHSHMVHFGGDAEPRGQRSSASLRSHPQRGRIDSVFGKLAEHFRRRNAWVVTSPLLSPTQCSWFIRDGNHTRVSSRLLPTRHVRGVLP